MIHITKRIVPVMHADWSISKPQLHSTSEGLTALICCPFADMVREKFNASFGKKV